MKTSNNTKFSLIGLVAFTTVNATTLTKPNIMVVLVDDMGYSDIGCYGGEINTPNIDKLAKTGLRYTQFYNGARSCPTRASLITGLFPHDAGIGWMTDRNLGYDGYVGDLSDQCTTIPEVLKPVGYSTYMAGKWHVVRVQDAKQDGNKKNWPLQRGFDKFFGTIEGAGNYWNPHTLKMGNDSIPAEKSFFYTDKIADYSIDCLNQHAKEKKNDPFFMYVAFTAPHWPLQARPKTIKKYENRYKGGWDNLREERYQRMIKLGIISPNWKLSPRDTGSKSWESLSAQEKKLSQKRMAIYAAMVDEIDQALGRIVAILKKNKQLDNTLILFLSDNGACAENISQGDKSIEALGTNKSFESYRLPWANASNTPFRLFKHWMHEGGISTPLIAHWGNGIKQQGELRKQPFYLIDIMATCVQLSGATYPALRNEKPIPLMEGLSLTTSFDNSPQTERYMFWEHEANCAARKGKWKIVRKASYTYPFETNWQLYDMEADRTEQNDVAANYPEMVTQMAAAWTNWATTHKVFPLDGRIHDTRIKNPIFNFPIINN
jgi:arylsulfatase